MRSDVTQHRAPGTESVGCFVGRDRVEYLLENPALQGFQERLGFLDQAVPGSPFRQETIVIVA
jgi:hypothetical protein